MSAAIVGAVVLGVFAVVLAAVALVERSIRRAREQQAAWEAVAERLRPAMQALGSSVAAFSVSFSEAATAAAAFSMAMRDAEDVFAASSDDIARLVSGSSQ